MSTILGISAIHTEFTEALTEESRASPLHTTN